MSDEKERVLYLLAEGREITPTMPWTNKKAVAFTECPFWSLIAHAKRYSPYGIGFTKAHLFAASGGPAIYLRPDLKEKQKEFRHQTNDSWRGFHPSVYSFITPFVPEYAPQSLKDSWDMGHVDFSHEREWRVPHDFTFELNQVQFIIVKSYEDMAKFPRELKDQIDRKKFIIMDIYSHIEDLWPTHKID